MYLQQFHRFEASCAPDDALTPYSSGCQDLSNHLKPALEVNSIYLFLLEAPPDFYNSSDLRLKVFVNHR
jgi:hypothetical protein